jgi:DNA replication ATP-dependent helicase Dna2
MAALVDGAEDWDWGDMESDFLTPKKVKELERDSSKSDFLQQRQEQLSSPESDLEPASELEYYRKPCTRCIVETVDDCQDGSGRYQKVTCLCEAAHFRLYLNYIRTSR